MYVHKYYDCDLLNLKLYVYVTEYWVQAGDRYSNNQATKKTREFSYKFMGDTHVQFYNKETICGLYIPLSGFEMSPIGATWRTVLKLYDVSLFTELCHFNCRI